MNDIKYTYEIIAVNEAARCMEIVYSSEIYGTMHVGARLPFEGENLEQIIAMYSPIVEWRLRDIPVILPVPGTKGEIIDSEPEPEPESKPEIPVISRLQAKAILLQYDLLDTVEALVAEQDAITQLAWKEAIEFNISSTLIQALKPHIKWSDGSDITDEEWDQLFIEASNISFS